METIKDTIEPTETPKSPAKVKRRKPKPRRAAAVRKVVQIPAAKDDALLGGLTATECPFDCTRDGCVISGIPFCGHPNKGGMPTAMQNDQDAVRRYNQARKALAHQALDRKP